VRGGRLAYFQRAASSDYWDERWLAEDLRARFAHARRGALDPIEDPCLRRLPRHGRILEAGCGPGHLVLALRARGFDAEGVEWAARTVENARRLAPDLPIRQGDVRRLDAPNDSYSGYISNGVVEHDPAGPEAALREAFRVLEPGGVALVAVPHYHLLRRLKAWLGLYRPPQPDDEFYQYAFAPRDMTARLRRSGFSVVEVTGYDPIKGLADEIGLFRRALALPWLGARLRRHVKRSRLLWRLAGHLLLCVCRKPGPVGDGPGTLGPGPSVR
jgi:SAM-dependent methyltransferase